MKLRLTRPALADIGLILAEIASHSPSAAGKVSRRLEERFEHIRHFPLAGRATDRPRIRYVNASPYPYLVFYEVADTVIVHAVRHGARDPRTMPGRRT